MSATLILAGLLTAARLPVVIEQTPPADLAESRLNGCLLAAASATDQPNLRAAVVQVRAHCGAQIARVRNRRVASATRGLKGAEAKAAATRTVLALNDEIARTIASMTGLNP